MKQRFAIVALLLWSAALALMPAAAQDDWSDEVEALLYEYTNEDEPGIVAYINYDGEIVSAAVGAANLDSGEQVTIDDYFRIGSVTKPMLAATVLSLAEDGLVDLDAPAADYVPADIADNLANADTATVRQLLQMTSGIPDYLGTDEFYFAFLDAPDTFWTPEQTLTFAYGLPADFPVGDGYTYSNSNYTLAQIVAESVTGQPLRDIMAERIFGPADMATCYLESPDTFAQNIVRGYDYPEDGGDGYADVTTINDGVGLGDGGVVCTAQDLAKFMPALIGGELIGDEMLAEMLDAVDDGNGGTYGLGIDYEQDGEYGYTLGHFGATSGFQSAMHYLPDENLSIVILTNFAESEAPEPLSLDLQALSFDDD